jgi:hypothetical protein
LNYRSFTLKENINKTFRTLLKEVFNNSNFSALIGKDKEFIRELAELIIGGLKDSSIENNH